MADETPRPDEQPENAPPQNTAPDSAGDPGPAVVTTAAATPPEPSADGVDLDFEPAVIGARTVPVSAADATPFTTPELGAPQPSARTQIDLLDDVQLDVTVELGRTNLYIEEVLKLGVGSVVELNKLAGDPVDVYVNERLIARGEVLVLNESFCVRISDIQCPVPEPEGTP
jgi:flagellar motor switch protein FliN/FliY